MPSYYTNKLQMEELKERILSLLSQHGGIIFAIAAALFYTGESFLMKVSNQTTDPFQLAMVMSFVMIICCIFVLVINGIPPPAEIEHYFWLFSIGVSISCYLIPFSLAVVYTDVGDAVTVTYASVVMVLVGSWLMLKEAPRLLDILFSILTFVGVAFISRPRFIFPRDETGSQDSDTDMLGVALAFGSAIATSFNFTIMRKLSSFAIHPCYPLLSGGIVTLISATALAFLLNRGKYQLSIEWVSSIAAGLCYFLGLAMAYCALEREHVPLVNIILTLDVILVFILQLVILDVHPAWTSYIGAMCIMSACFGITLNKKLSDINEI